MEWFYSLIFGGGIAHTIFTLALVITIGIILGKIKIGGVSIGITWVLFVGIAIRSMNISVDAQVLDFVKEFGLILFIFSIGLQVGPSFFTSFKQGGMKLVACATAIVALGIVTAYTIHLITGTPIPTMVGILSGAVTNTPGLGAAQQAYTDVTGVNDPTIALGYAVSYPLGVLGIIISMLLIRYICRIRLEKEDNSLAAAVPDTKNLYKISVELINPNINGLKVSEIQSLIKRDFVISRIKHSDGNITIAEADSTINMGELLLVICTKEDKEAIIAFFGQSASMSDTDWNTSTNTGLLISRRILITKSEINGKKFSDLNLRSRYGITITRVNRAGVDLIPSAGLELQIGDRVMVVGPEKAVSLVESVLGNSLKRLDQPNLLTIFIGITLGVILGSIPLLNVPQPLKLGLAGGPLIIAILIGRFGSKFRLITYTTVSVNLMLREIGIALFLAAVGLSAGDGFIDAIAGGGYLWILYGFIITIVPIMLVGLFARSKLKMNYYTLMGLIAGSTTDPPALAYANGVAGNDMPAVSYSTVYPVVMFLRILTAQALILLSL